MNFQIRLTEAQQRALKLVLYSVCAGFFGIFTRWMQSMVCFDENGLPETGFWTFAVPLLCIVAAFVFSRFINQFRDKHYYISSSSDDFPLKNDSRIYRLVRIFLSVVMCGGALVLFMESEIDKNIDWLRAVAALGFISGLCLFLFFSIANRPKQEIPMGLMCLYSFFPILLFCVWLLTLYKINAINSIVAAYGIDIIAACFAAIAFFRIAGFAFGTPNVWRTLFFGMFSAFMTISVITDCEYFGMQLMLGASAGFFLLTVWILAVNMVRRDAMPKVQPVDGFERFDAPEYNAILPNYNKTGDPEIEELPPSDSEKPSSPDDITEDEEFFKKFHF